MIHNVRAKGILQIIFSVLNDKTKLYIINHNKILYEKLEIILLRLPQIYLQILQGLLWLLF